MAFKRSAVRSRLSPPYQGKELFLASDKEARFLFYAAISTMSIPIRNCSKSVLQSIYLCAAGITRISRERCLQKRTEEPVLLNAEPLCYGFLQRWRYDVLEMSGSRAVWEDILAVYSVKVNTDPDNPMEVATVDDTKKQLLTNIF